MTKGQIEKFDKAKEVEEEDLEKDQAKLQSKGFIPAYLKKVEDEVDVLENTIDELVEVSLDPNDPEKKVLVGAPLMKKEKEELM